MSTNGRGDSPDTGSRHNTGCRTYNPSPKGSDSGSFTDYSESFDSDEESPVNQMTTQKAKSEKAQGTKKKKDHEPTGTTRKANAVTNLKATSKASKASPRQNDSITHRMLSARRNKVNLLKSKLEEMNSQLEEMRRENKILKRHERLQEKALCKLDKDENEVSELLRKHSAEVNTLREQLRRQRTKARQEERKSKQMDDELACTKRQLRRMTSLVEDRHLAEREELTRRLARVEATAEQNDRRAKELETHVEHLKKNHRHELGIERAHQREIQRELLELRHTCEQKDLQLKEKEKELNIRYIYSNRVVRPPHKLNLSISSSPLPPTGSARQRVQRKKSDPMLTPRARAKLYEQQRLQNEQHKKENLAHTHTVNTPIELSDEKNKSLPPSELHFRFGTLQETQSRNDQTPQQTNEAQIQNKHHHTADSIHNSAPQSNLEKYQQELAKHERLLAEKEAEHQAAVEASNELKEQEWWKQAAVERREQEAVRSKEQLSRERQQRKEEERRQEQQQRQEGQRLEWQREEEQQRLEEQTKRDEQEKKQREEEERLQKEQADKEARRQAEEQKKAREEAEKIANSAAEKERRRQKDLLLAKLREMDNKAMTPVKESASYTFSKPVENMHNGLPALENVNVPVLKTRKKSLFDEDNDYKPSFGSAKRNTGSLFRSSPDIINQPSSSRNKSNLMAQLFGTNAEKSGEGDDRIKNNLNKREPTSTALFGGGSAILDDDIPPFSNKPHLLPRRQRHLATTVHTGPTVNAIDDIDDDVEELIL